MGKSTSPMRRYHYKVYLPENTSEMCLDFFNQLNYVNVTYHAAYQMCDDPRCIIDLPGKEDLFRNSSRLVEFYETLNDNQQPAGMIQKMLLRVPHLSEKFDFNYLVSREGYIVSAWCLEKTDIPRLTKSLYEYYCPNELKKSIYEKFNNLQRNTVSFGHAA